MHGGLTLLSVINNVCLYAVSPLWPSELHLLMIKVTDVLCVHCSSRVTTSKLRVRFSIIGGFFFGGGGGPPKYPLCPHEWHILNMQHIMNTCSTSPDCSVLAELRDWDGVKAIANYAGLRSTSEETKVLAP